MSSVQFPEYSRGRTLRRDDRLRIRQTEENVRNVYGQVSNILSHRILSKRSIGRLSVQVQPSAIEVLDVAFSSLIRVIRLASGGDDMVSLEMES